MPLSRWSSLELAAQAVTEGLVDVISSSTVRRWLHADAIKPWRYRSWIFPRDPDFARKAARVLEVVKPADFADLAALADRLCRFEHRYNTTARPFDWRFTRSDLAEMLARLDAHRLEPEAPSPPERAGQARWEAMKAPPESTKHSLTVRLNDHARTRWPELAGIEVRFRANFAYVNGRYGDGTTIKLCRLRYGGSSHTWGFALYRASHNDYENSYLPNGMTAGSAEEALDCACGLYLNDPSAWLPDTPTN